MSDKRFLAIELKKRILRKTGTREEIEDEIRDMADCDESFENMVFELGCSVLAKTYVKKFVKGENNARLKND